MLEKQACIDREVISSRLCIHACNFNPGQRRDSLFRSLQKYIFGPDFPTGGQIIGKKGITEAFETGKGGCVVRSKTSIENFKKDREAIILHEIPYQVNKSKLLERIAEIVKSTIF